MRISKIIMVLLSILLSRTAVGGTEPGLFFQNLSVTAYREYLDSLDRQLESPQTEEAAAEIECGRQCLTNWKGCGSFLAESYAAYPGNASIAGRYCWNLISTGKIQEAQQVLSKIQGALPENEYLVLLARIEPNEVNLRDLEIASLEDDYARLTLLKIYYQRGEYVQVTELAGKLTEEGETGPYLEAAVAYQLEASALSKIGGSRGRILTLWRRAFEIDPENVETVKNLWLALFTDKDGGKESLQVANRWWELSNTEEAALAAVRSTEKVDGADAAFIRLIDFQLKPTLETELMRAGLLVCQKRFAEGRRLYAQIAKEHRHAAALLGFVTAASYDKDAPEGSPKQAADIAKAFLEKEKIDGYEHAQICVFALLRAGMDDQALNYTDKLLASGKISAVEASRLKSLCALHQAGALQGYQAKER